MAKKDFRRTWNGRLTVIEQFGVEVVQKVRSGKPTTSNHPGGDLYHAQRRMFTEVKASGLSGGALIREVQLQQHFDNLEKFDSEYALVFYQNRRWSRGRYHTLPMRIGKTKRLLRQFLVEHVQEVYVLHISVIWAVYKAHPELMKTYQMKEGLRRVFKLTRKLVKKLVGNIQEFSELGLDPAHYEFTARCKNIRLDGSSIPVYVYQITSRLQAEDDSFDVASFDIKTV